jgi:hypothetical protein
MEKRIQPDEMCQDSLPSDVHTLPENKLPHPIRHNTLPHNKTQHTAIHNKTLPHTIRHTIRLTVAILRVAPRLKSKHTR